MDMTEPPPFQEAPRCVVCNCSFSTFRRRHHCRCCGRTLCHEHSSNQMALPQFGIYTDVRVCADCYNNSSRSKKAESHTSNNLEATEDKLSLLSVNEEKGESAATPSVTNAPECKCGMPLCICEAPAPALVAEPAPPQRQNPSSSSAQTKHKPRKAINREKTDDPMKSVGTTTNSKQSLFFNLGPANNGTVENSSIKYEVNGEGLREAIKNHDAAAVRKLLSQGVDANYSDKQGSSLLHLAALFNQTEVAFILMDHGARADCKNAQGETPLDCAPIMLQNKMKRKMEDV